jgi:hypothetical protein
MFSTERLEKRRESSKSVEGNSACENGDVPKKIDMVSGFSRELGLLW